LITWAFCNCTLTGIPISEMVEAKGDNVPLVSIIQWTFRSNKSLILWKSTVNYSEIMQITIKKSIFWHRDP